MRAIVVGLLLLLQVAAGCASAQKQPGFRPAAYEQDLLRVQEALRHWGRAPSGNAPDWVGIDEDGLLAGGISADFGKMEHGLEWVGNWFHYPALDRALFVTGGWKLFNQSAGTWTALAYVTREDLARWPASPGGPVAPTGAHERYLTLYGERSATSQKPHTAVLLPVQRWLRERLGTRFVDASLFEQTLHIVVKPGNLTESERLLEATQLTAVAYAVSTWDIEVEYQGVAIAGRVKTREYGLLEWLLAGGGPEHVAGWMRVDGALDRSKQLKTESLPVAAANGDFAGTLRSRERWRAFLPAGARLTVGEDRLHPHAAVLTVEAEIPGGVAWEQAWAQYRDVLNEAFTQIPGSYQVNLVLTRGGEMEFHEYTWSRWRVAMHGAGEKFPPELLPAAANRYERFVVRRP